MIFESMEPKRILAIQSKMNFTVKQMAESLNVPSGTYEKWIYAVAKPAPLYVSILESWERLIEQERRDELLNNLSNLSAMAFLGWILFEVGKDSGKRKNPIIPKTKKRRRKDAD